MSRWQTIFALILSVMLFNTTNAEFVPLRSDLNDDLPKVEVLTHNETGLVLEVRLPGVELLTATLDGKKWDRVEIPGGGYYLDLGAPETPHFTRLIAIPATAGLRAEFELLEETKIDGIELMPAQSFDIDAGQSQQLDTYFDMATYSNDEFYPELEVMTAEPALFHGLRVAALRMNPVRYNPVSRELKIVHRFRVTVRFEGVDRRNVPSRPMRPVSRSWAKVMRSAILNFDELDLDETITGSYLIVCENDSYLVNTLLIPLIDWKVRKGHTVVVETFSAGSSNSAIKSIIQNAYDTWEIPPEYVLLVGDTSGNYALPGWSPSGIDHPYSQLDGGDILADVAVGRIPVDDATHAVAMFNKVLWYEKMPFTANDLWYHQGCLVAGSYLSGLSTILTNRWIKDRMVEHEYTRIDTFWYSMGGSSVNTCIVNAVNDGVTYVNYRGWVGMENFSTTSIDNLYNGFMMPFTTTITCGTGGFDGDSIMEHFISVGTAALGKGAIASVGTATLSTHTRYNNTFDIGIYAGLFDEGITQPGNAVVRGKLELYNAYQTHEAGQVSSFSNWNALAGDPGLELFTGPIQYMDCNVPVFVTWGENALSLTVNESGVGPLENAIVCFYKAGEVHEVGLTNANGQITLPISIDVPGMLYVTITKQNFYPIVDSLNVVQTGVAVGYFDHTIDDDTNGSSSGDNDGVVNPGEDVEVPLIFKNYGSANTATGISVTATSSDPYVTIGDDYETFPDLVPGATGSSDDDLDVSIADNCPHGHTVHLDFNTSSNQGSWDGGLELEVISYDMTVLRAYASGPDTLLSPGETADFNLLVRNDGGKIANSLTATITSLDPFVTVNDNSATFGTVAMGGSATSTDPFNLTANLGTINGDPADLEVTFSNSFGATQTVIVRIYLGAKTTIDPQGPDEYGYYCFDNGDLGYPQAPIYDWVEIDPAYGGSGTQLSITDPGENQDESVNVSLPFNFRYYGEDFGRITVCSNGWLSTHTSPAIADFRNYPIPSAMGPHGMVAAFWDDLITWSGGHVFSYYDVPNNRFIIEWSRLKHLHNSGVQETFEIILFDPAYYSTPTGDAEILFQYNQITEVYYYDNPYSTIGIESPDQLDGIEVVYWNTYDDPAAAQVQNGRAYLFTTNTALTGEPPVIGVDPASLTLNVPLGGTGSEILTISNGGELFLSYNISITDPSGPTYTDDLGGPDNYGYVWVDSDEPGGPDYNWIDISGMGTSLTFSHNDSTTSELPVGFPFPFYGDVWNNFIVSANGWISFSSHSGAWDNMSIPNPSAPPHLISGFWDDLDPLQVGADVRYWSNNTDSLVVSFLSVPHWGTTTVGEYTFQMILTDDGSIVYQYGSLSGNYQSCTVGMQDGNGTDGLEVAYNEAYLHEGLAVKFYHPVMVAVPNSGAVPGSQSEDVEVICYGYGMEAGTYSATLGIDCNDPVTPHVDVPLTIIVQSGPNPGMVVELTYQSGSPVPPGGGNIYFDVYVANNSSQALDFDAWLDVAYEGGPPTTVVIRGFTNYLPGWAINRPNTFFPVPASYAAGNYTMTGRVGNHPSVVWDESGFPFVKSGTSDGSAFVPWVPEGVPDPFDRIDTGAPPEELPMEFALLGNYPNPFNPFTVISYQLPVVSFVNLTVYDVTGRTVAELVNGWQDAGMYEVSFGAKVLASGVYFYRLEAGEFVDQGKMILLK